MILREIKNIYIKNRLTEGVDFKRYEWLKANIPINTTMMRLPISSKNFEFQRNWIQLMNSGYFATSGSNRFSYYIMNYGSENDLKPKIWNADSRSDKYTSPNVLGLGLHTIIANYNGVTISSATDTATLHWYGEPNYISFNNASNINKNTIHLTSSIKVDDVVRYVPCQLLKSIPATLDANNKSRAAGECGMYDSITGKFYGNVSSTGSFTVEGEVEPENHSGLQQIYQNRLIEGEDYETADWLRSTGGAQIGLNYTNNGNYEIELIELKGKELKTVGNDYSQILGGTFGWKSGLFTIAINFTNGRLAFAQRDAIYPSAFQEFTLKVTPSETSGNLDVNINNKTYVITKHPLYLTKLFCWQNPSGNYSQLTEGCVGHLKVDNYCNMYPCQLLRSIPRNLDAQCKERVAGECGMIDLISGKFYGNVANSGTFTVENDNNE